MYRLSLTLVVTLFFSACASTYEPYSTQPPASPVLDETEYDALPKNGSASITGQVFLRQRNGNVVYGAGSPVTLDPKTAYSSHWWTYYARKWESRDVEPRNPIFFDYRRTTVADAEGRFTFKSVPPGAYYLRSIVTWETFSPGPFYSTTSNLQGGLVFDGVELVEDEERDVILTIR